MELHCFKDFRSLRSGAMFILNSVHLNVSKIHMAIARAATHRNNSELQLKRYKQIKVQNLQ